MDILFSSQKLELQCTDIRAAQKLFGGNKDLARSLLSRIHAIHEATVLKDIILMPPFHFHRLYGDREGLFAIDVKSRREPWRIILEPLDDKGEPFVPCRIDEIAGTVRIVGIMEVSNHYE